MKDLKSKKIKRPYTYTIEEHQHRFAAWAASSAASTSPLCRFKVKAGVEILETCGFNADLSGPDNLPRAEEFDKQHNVWRVAVIAAARRRALPFTHGVAAKLINCYLKSRFVCGGQHKHKRVVCLHPPIDARLLKALVTHNIGGFAKEWRVFRNKRWSKYDSRTYQDVINLIRRVLPSDDPLWMIEKWWEGHQ